MPSDSQRIQEIFLQLVSLAPQDRLVALDRECGSDEVMRNRLAALLQAHDLFDRILDQPPESWPATSDSDPRVSNADATNDFESYGHSPDFAPVPPTLTASESKDTIPETNLGDRYVLLEKIGEGGMGEVWVAKQTEPIKRKVAIKLIKKGMDSRAVLQRFEQERQALAIMDHPNIARVFDGGITSIGQPYFVMELVKGLPLNKFCDEMTLTVQQRLELFVSICQAVQHAHQKGIVHRDLKPANILVTLVDSVPVPKVIDFGVAKAISGKLLDESLFTGFGTVVGTLEYMAPEQAGYANVHIDTRADIYSLGVILYELLTGLRPFDRNQLRKAAVTELIRLIHEEEPQRPSKRLSTDASLPTLAAMRRVEPKRLTAWLRGDLDWVVMKCLEKSRERRYETANALARDVQRYLANETVEARPPSSMYRLKKFLRRHRRPVIAGTTIFASLGLGVFAFAWQAKVAREKIDAQAKVAREKIDASHLFAMESQARARADAWQAVNNAELAKQMNDLKDQAQLSIFAMQLDFRHLLDASPDIAGHIAYQHSQSQCENNAPELGILRMAHSLETTLRNAEALERSIRTSMSLWTRLLPMSKPWNIGIPNLREAKLSPNGKSVLLVGVDGIVRTVNVATSTVQDEIPEGAFGSCIYSNDGRFIAIQHSATTLRLWDSITGQAVGEPLDHKDGSITSMAFHPDGHLLVTATSNSLHYWNVDEGVEAGEPTPHQQFLRGVEISPDGDRMLTRTEGEVRIWKFTSRSSLHTLKGIDFDVIHASFSPNSKWVCVAGLGRRPPEDAHAPKYEAQLFDAIDGSPVGNRMRWNDSPFSESWVQRPSFHPDGNLVVIGGSPARLWSVPSGKPAGIVAPLRSMSSTHFTHNGRQLLSISEGQLLWTDLPRMSVPQAIVKELSPADGNWILSSGIHDRGLSIAPDGRSAMVSLCSNAPPHRARYRWFDLATGNLLHETSSEDAYDVDNDWIPEPAFSADGQTVAVATANHACKLWSNNPGREVLPSVTMDSQIMSVALSPNGDLLATGAQDGRVQLWSVESGMPLGPALSNGEPAVALAFSPDNSTLAVGTSSFSHPKNGSLRLWRVSTCEPIDPKPQWKSSVTSVVFSPDGRTVVAGTHDSRLRLFDAKTGVDLWARQFDTIHPRAHAHIMMKENFVDYIGDAKLFNMMPRAPGEEKSYIEGNADIGGNADRVAFSPDGMRIIIRLPRNRAVCLFDARDGAPSAPLITHRDAINSAELSPDGNFVLTTSDDQTMRLWDSTLGIPLGPVWKCFPGSRAVFAADGRSILMTDDRNQLVRWELPPPIKGSAEQIRLATEAATGISLDSWGFPYDLDPRNSHFFLDVPSTGSDPWQAFRMQLEQLMVPR